MLSRKFQFYLGIVNTFPAVFYIFLGIFSAFMHKISHSASPREKFYAFWQRKCQEKCRKQLEKWWQFLGKISTCLTLLPHVGNLYCCTCMNSWIISSDSGSMNEIVPSVAVLYVLHRGRRDGDAYCCWSSSTKYIVHTRWWWYMYVHIICNTYCVDCFGSQS